MPQIGYVLVLVSGLAIMIFAALQFRRDRRWPKLLLQCAVVAFIFAAIVHFFSWPNQVISKGPEDDQTFLAAVIAIYLCSVFGMLAEAFYNYLDKSKTERKGSFDWGATLKPLFVSPILLIPTIGAFQNANIDLMKLDFPRLMILLTAFEKGFLWRHYLVKRTEAVKAEPASKGAAA